MTKREFVRHRQYFFSVFTSKQRPCFELPESVSVLNTAFAQAMRKYPFEMDAIVILPDHLHCIWTMPENDEETAKRWRVIKFWFSSHCDASLRQKGEAIWSGRFVEQPLRSARDYAYHVDYIHYDAVSHGMAQTPADWPYSSFARYVQMGWLHQEWGETKPELPDWVGYEKKK